MRQQPMENFARELREAVDSGVFIDRGRVALSDGVTVDPQRMARIVLVDFERIDRDGPGAWLTEGDKQALYDDLLRLLALARQPIRK